MVQVTVEKVGLDQDGEQAVVLLADLTKTTLIPIWIRALEASAIALPLQGLTAPRPLTSDLVISVTERLGADVVMAIIREVKDGAFYASLVLTKNEEEIEIDCRASDAIAVALRRASPIYVMERVLVEAGIRSEEDNVQ
jgi:hypothetical protein